MSDFLKSEQIVVSAPMSFHGAFFRAWKLTRISSQSWTKIITIPLTLILIICWWALIVVWYFVFGLLLVPYRLIRRSSRKRKLDNQRHRELLSNKG